MGTTKKLSERKRREREASKLIPVETKASGNRKTCSLKSDEELTIRIRVPHQAKTNY